MDAEPDENAPSISTTATESITADVDYLADAIFPCKIKYMDLFVLQMRFKPRVPEMELIREEWEAVTRILEDRDDGIYGSVLITGQPGIGTYRSHP